MKVIKVIQIETFDGKQYLIRRDKPYEEELLQLIQKLIDGKTTGSIAHISLGTVSEKIYLDIPNVGSEINSLQIKKGSHNGND
jgi:hypothetical protein